MIDKTLQHLIEAKLTSAREISELAGVSTSTVYRWIAGESQPDFHSIRLLLRHISHRRAQEALLTAFASGTGWHFLHSNTDTDVNDDGKVDGEDALDAAIQAIKAAAHTLEQLRAAQRDHELTPDETVRVVATLNHVINRSVLTQQILVEMSDRRQRARDLKLAR